MHGSVEGVLGDWHSYSDFEGMRALYIPTNAYIADSGAAGSEEGLTHLGRQLRAAVVGRPVRALQQLPEIAVAGAVVQAVAVADRRPAGGLRGEQDLDRQIHFGGGRREGVDDDADLVGVDDRKSTRLNSSHHS